MRVLIGAWLSVLSCALLLMCLDGCSGGAPEDEFVPGQEGRVDGSVWSDGMFNSEQAKVEFCAENGDAWFCNELGTAEQEWSSAEYHGLAQGEDADTCYGPSSDANGDCMFPFKKKFQVIVNNINCFTGPPPPAGPSTLYEQAMLDGAKNATLAWNGAGGAVVCLAGQAGCGTPQSDYVNVYINCVTPSDSAALAEGGLIGTVGTPVGNAPVGPHSGKDVDDFKISDLGHIKLAIPKIWQSVQSCTPLTVAKVYSWMGWTVAHEMGHVIAFSHFNNTGTLMYPFRPNGCNPGVNIDQKYKDALDGYSPTGGAATVTNELLQNLLPL